MNTLRKQVKRKYKISQKNAICPLPPCCGIVFLLMISKPHKTMSLSLRHTGANSCSKLLMCMGL